MYRKDDDVIEVRIEVKTKAWYHPGRTKLHEEIINFLIDKGYQVASKGVGRGVSDALLHPKGTKLS
ncbi:unnamed protein product [marine sediment metagenome]|uniref:Uncharacterized protein n=1 Tax=marine sediment metagenome TaxID=412755 RepID=X0RV46_9ZZZZ